MATLRRSRDHSLWFKHIDDPDGSLLPHLQRLSPGQSVVLLIGSQTGVWTRFNATPKGGVPDALKSGDENAKQIWDDLPVDGPAIKIALVNVLSMAESKRRDRHTGKVELDPVSIGCQDHNVLCMAVDVAWWGGQTGKSKSDTRTETIAHATRIGGKWSDLTLERINLNPLYNPKADRYTPNADPKASILSEGIKSVLSKHEQVERVVLGLDMPILAIDDGLPDPVKANDRGAKGGKNRQCDSAWIKQRSASPKGWKHVNIFAGAPVVPRVAALVDQLRQLDFEVFGLCDTDQPRLVVECFPNEVIWSIGVLGLAEGFTLDSFQLYKRLGKKRIPLPKDVFAGIWKHTINLAFTLAGLDSQTRLCWIDGFEKWLAADGVFDEATGIGLTGKNFDDAVESVLSLSAVVGLVTGNSHIHQGTDPEDGHIIGPGVASNSQNGK